MNIIRTDEDFGAIVGLSYDELNTLVDALLPYYLTSNEIVKTQDDAVAKETKKNAAKIYNILCNIGDVLGVDFDAVITHELAEKKGKS